MIFIYKIVILQYYDGYERGKMMNIKVGQKFILIPEGDTIHLVLQYSIDDVKGLLPDANTSNYRDRKDRKFGNGEFI